MTIFRLVASRVAVRRIHASVYHVWNSSLVHVCPRDLPFEIWVIQQINYEKGSRQASSLTPQLCLSLYPLTEINQEVALPSLRAFRVDDKNFNYSHVIWSLWWCLRRGGGELRDEVSSFSFLFRLSRRALVKLISRFVAWDGEKVNTLNSRVWVANPQHFTRRNSQVNSPISVDSKLFICLQRGKTFRLRSHKHRCSLLLHFPFGCLGSYRGLEIFLVASARWSSRAFGELNKLAAATSSPRVDNPRRLFV